MDWLMFAAGVLVGVVAGLWFAAYAMRYALKSGRLSYHPPKKG